MHLPFVRGTEVSVWSLITFPCPVTSRGWIKQKPALFSRPWELTWFHHRSKFPLGIEQPDSHFYSAFVLPANHPFIWSLRWMVLHAHINSWAVIISATSGWPRCALAPLWAGFDPVLSRIRSCSLLSPAYSRWWCSDHVLIFYSDPFWIYRISCYFLECPVWRHFRLQWA